MLRTLVDTQEMIIEGQNAQLIIQNMGMERMNQTLHEEKAKRADCTVLFPRGKGRHLTNPEMIQKKRDLEQEKQQQEANKEGRKKTRETQRAEKQRLEELWKTMLVASSSQTDDVMVTSQERDWIPVCPDGEREEKRMHSYTTCKLYRVSDPKIRAICEQISGWIPRYLSSLHPTQTSATKFSPSPLKTHIISADEPAFIVFSPGVSPDSEDGVFLILVMIYSEVKRQEQKVRAYYGGSGPRSVD